MDRIDASGQATLEGGKPSEEGRGDYLGFVAHEVRNPLSTALWSAELLARMPAEERAGARGEKLTQMCLRSLGRVRQLVEDHFLCERLDAHGIPTRAERVPLRALVEEIAGRRGLDLANPELQIAPELLVNADRTLLDRALEALLACAGREGAAVRVSADTGQGRVEIRVEGAELGPDPLRDPRKGTQGDPRGRALALPMARRIAAALGGVLVREGGALVLTMPGDMPYVAEGAEPAAHP
jgi:signal transduction histidine kinase